MTTDSAHDTPRVPRRHESLDEQARRKGVRPVERIEDMAEEGVFSSDEELEEFILYTYANRREGLA